MKCKYLLLLPRSAVLYRLTMFVYYKAFLKLDHHTRDFPGPTHASSSLFNLVTVMEFSTEMCKKNQAG